MNFATFLRSNESEGGRRGPTFDGAPVTSQEQLGEGAAWRSAPSSPSPHYARLYDEARRMVDAALTGNKWSLLRLQEAMTTSDFPLLFGDILDRSVLANYAETPYTWNQYAKRVTLSDMRLARIFRVDRGASVLDGPIVPNSSGASGTGSSGLTEISEYPMAYRTVSGYTDQIYKFGRRMDFSFEVFLNDDLDALRDTPALFGRAARRTEEKRATQLFMTASGPNSTFFSNANKNLINNTVLGSTYTGAANPPLSIESLMWALTVLAQQRDKDGEPISIESAVLVYGPALKVTAENILNAREIWTNVEGGSNAQNASLNAMTNGTRLVVANWASKIARGALNYYIPVVDTTYGNTSWYLFSDPNAGRPAMQQSFLRGREAPQLFMRLPNQVALGEGAMGPGPGPSAGMANTNPMEGDFETDGIDYKVRHFLGGALLDPVCAVASNGSGS